MAERYQQFLGSKPGIVVELVDDSGSPYTVRTEQGFEFSISAEDFKNYYRKENDPSPARWNHLVTDPERGMVESGKMAEAMEIIKSFDDRLGDFDKARAFVRDVVAVMAGGSGQNLDAVRARLKELGWDPEALASKDWKILEKLPDDLHKLLLSETCAVIPFLPSPAGPNGDAQRSGAPVSGRKTATPKAKKDGTKSAKKSAPSSKRGGMKNVELSVDKDLLTVTVDLSKEFGPSKSAKSIIVASTQGNKTVPGREEKIGLNVYRQETQKPAKGRRKEFKNVLMSVDHDILTLEIDLSKEFGPSKSGQTTIIASTEGNQLVYGSEKKIGLNVYRKID